MSHSVPNAASSEARITQLEQQLYWAHLKIQMLEEKLRQRRIAIFGPRSEKLSDLQLELLELEPSVSAQEVAAEVERANEPVAPQPKPKRKKHPGRQTLPENLERIIEVIPCPAEACQCKSCGAETTVIGHDQSEQLDVHPAQYFVRLTRREKRACRSCSEGTVQSAPLPVRIVDKSLVSNRIIVDAIISKYADHLPLYRQSVILERETGVSISRATIDGWVMRVGDLLIPVVKAMQADLLRGSYLQADETTVAVQTHDQRGSNHQAYLWQYSRPGGEIVFDFCMGRGRAGPKKFLGPWEGRLQTDGYQAYEGVGGPKMVHAGCWAHARRKFVDAVKLSPEDAEALKMVTRMDALFLIDRCASGKSVAERHEQRQQASVSWVEEIHQSCLGLQHKQLPQSAMGQAVNYVLNQWKKLVCFLEHPEVELSTNLAENSMRPVALGRNNWLHIGSVDAGPRVAAILSVVESCRRMRVPVKEYLGSALPGLGDRPVSEVANLTPEKWSLARRSGLV